MYKLLIIFLLSGLMGFGVITTDVVLFPDYQTPIISQDNGDDIGSDMAVQKAMSQEIPQVGHEPLPPPPPPPDDDGYVLAEIGFSFP